jgi:N-acetylglucosaminyl-diphospho-decaprenol L-rhamnosyltransferase
MSRLEAVTVTTNDAPILEGLLDCAPLRRCFDRLVVVDNASTDGSAALARARGAEVVRVTRGGYGASVNRGARELSGQFLCVLNPDIRFFDDRFGPSLLHHFDDPRVGLVAPALRLRDGRLQDSARVTPTPVDLVMRRWVAPQLGAVRTAGDVDWVVGACFVVRREAWEAVGGFDERFFLYFDDVDLCQRLRRAGWRVRFDPAYEVEHAHQGASRRSLTSFATRQHMRSAARFFARNPRYALPLPANRGQVRRVRGFPRVAERAAPTAVDGLEPDTGS